MQLPGRTINTETRIVVRRMLPVEGEVLVQRGQRVEPLQVVAQAEVPSRYRVIDVARHLNQPKIDMARVMLKTVGDEVTAYEAIAAAPGGFLPFLQRRVYAPANGVIAAIGPGWVLLETERAPLEVQAFINGTVTQIIPNRGVVIETSGAMIEAACGFGGDAYGRLHRLAGSPFDEITTYDLTERLEQTIIVVGSSIDEAILRRAEELRIRGFIVGSIDAALLSLTPPVKVRVVATEGFGRAPMSAYTFGLLTALNGREISMRGQTPFLAAKQTAELEPPIILATTGGMPGAEPQPGRDIRVGSRVRVTWGNWLGATGHIDSVPPQPQPTEAGVIAPGAYVNIDTQAHYIPWANLEQIN